MPRTANFLVGLLLLVIVLIGLWEYQWDLTMLEQSIRAHPFLGMALYVVLVLTSIVVLPFSSLPLLPVAARVFGIWITAILSIIGWWIGCLIAFQIARFGRKYLEKVTSLEAVDKMEQKIPKDISFAGIVILRMVFPVDVTSFALGLLKHLSFSTYAIASLIGIIPFAFVWSYAGGELGRGQFLTSTFILIGMIFVVLLIRRAWRKHR